MRAWLGHTSQRLYQAGDMSGYKATRSAMGDMAKSLTLQPPSNVGERP
jgi:hypothetical protein